MTYKQALAECKRLGTAHCSEEAALAGLCSTLRTFLGAVSPKLIFEGAQRRGIKLEQLQRMLAYEPEAVRSLQRKEVLA